MKLPGLGGLDVVSEVRDFKVLLQSISHKLDILIEIERGEVPEPTCGACDQIGRLACPEHGPEARR